MYLINDGYIEKVLIQKGKLVYAGQPLFRIINARRKTVTSKYNGIVSEIYVKEKTSYPKNQILIKIEENKGEKGKETNQDSNQETRSKKRIKLSVDGPSSSKREEKYYDANDNDKRKMKRNLRDLNK